MGNRGTSLRRFVLLTAIGVVVGSLALLVVFLTPHMSGGSQATNSGKPATHSSPTIYAPNPGAKTDHDGLSIQVTGTCKDKGGFHLKSSGFTPKGEYHTTAKSPDGSHFTHFLNGGVGYADENGATPDWVLDCKNAPGGMNNGVYTLTILDVTKNKSVSTTFQVWNPSN
jgi:hypothetical protein